MIRFDASVYIVAQINLMDFFRIQVQYTQSTKSIMKTEAFSRSHPEIP